MKLIYSKFIPFEGYKAINLFGLCFVRRGSKMSEADIRHETIHTRQMLELAVVFFYVLYLLEWLIRLPMKGNAYRNISFEREAYGNQSKKDYLTTRRHYAWLHYMKKNKKHLR